MNQARRNVINSRKAAAAPAEKPRLLFNREPRYKTNGEMYAQDIELGFVEAGWPERRA